MEKKSLISLLTLFILITSITGCANKNEAKTETVYTVKVMHPQNNASLNIKDYVGIIEGNKNSKLSFQLPGKLAYINVKEGQYVRKGTLLAALDVTNLKHQADAAKATLDQANDAFRRLKILYDNGSLPEIKFIDVKTKVSQASSVYAITQRNLEESKLYAPFSGVIGHRAVQVGENIIPSQEVFMIIDMSRLKVRFDVPEQEISKIHLGDTAIVSVGVLSDKKFTAKVTSRRLDASCLTHSYPVCITLDNNSSEIISGMACDIKLAFSSATLKSSKTYDSEILENPMVVPISSVQVSFTGENYVWLAENGKAIKRTVEIGDFLSGGLIIKKGLKQSNLVIIQGYHKLSNASKIKIHE